MRKSQNSREAAVYHTREAEVGLTLVSALRRWLPQGSWSEQRQLVRGRHVQINGNLCLDEGRRLKLNDVVKVHDRPMARPPKADDVQIVYIDNDVVVIDKPSGITSVRHAKEQSWPARRKQFQPTLDEIVPQLVARQHAKSAVTKRKSRHQHHLSKGASRHSQRIYPVHRLDRDTSGLMIFARTPMAEKRLIDQFKVHSIERTYIALAIGDVAARRIESRIARDRGDGQRGSIESTEDGQRAVTHVRPLKKMGRCTLIECRLETGRTHQIRIHLSETGHMICGEKVYTADRHGKKMVDPVGAPRLALHAAKLRFTHPVSGRELIFEAELPRDLKSFLDRLQRESIVNRQSARRDFRDGGSESHRP